MTKVLENLRGNSLLDEVESLVQMEQKLPRSYSWKAYPIDHILFWKGIARKIERRRRSHRKARQDTRIVRDIVQRYVNEIKGSFSIPLHRFSNFAGSLLFRILLGRMRYDTQSQARIYSRLKVQGDLAKLRALSDIGSIVYAPTHTSNMDSMLIGHFFHLSRMPPAIFGAGLNVYNVKLIAYLLAGVGTYRIDRKRRANRIYITTLVSYLSLIIKYGCPTLFYPGGTRSRSGKIEEKLRQGLLSSAIESQRSLFQANPESKQKIFVVPIVLSYWSVFEANGLIRQHLASIGEGLLERKKGFVFWVFRNLVFASKILLKKNHVTISFGEPMDVLGNTVNAKGESLAPHGGPIDLKHYFSAHDRITKDSQREKVYVSMMSKEIVSQFQKINCTSPSQVVAFTIFELLKKAYPRTDLKEHFLPRPSKHAFPLEEIILSCDSVSKRLLKMAKSGRIRMDDDFPEDPQILVEAGIKSMGAIHYKVPLKRKKDQVIINDPLCLFYYHNRLDGYGLDRWV